MLAQITNQSSSRCKAKTDEKVVEPLVQSPLMVEEIHGLQECFQFVRAKQWPKKTTSSVEIESSIGVLLIGDQSFSIACSIH